MVIVADSIPGLKRWLAPLGLNDSTRLLVIRVIAAFLFHPGRMSCLRAGVAVRCEPRHRAQISRFLARPRWREHDINSVLRQDLLEREVADGLFIYILDATLASQAGKKTENTYSTGNRKRRPCKGRRYGKNKRAAQELPQLYDGPADHALRDADPLLQALSHPRVLRRRRASSTAPRPKRRPT